ncbi:MAG: hypothetical protein ABGX16_00565 [Pirellulales bacterium]
MIPSGPQIDLGEESIAQRVRQAKRDKGQGPWWVRGILLVGVVMLVGFLVGGVLWWKNSAQAPRRHEITDAPVISEESVARTAMVLPESPSLAAAALLQDDGELIWDSPTRGFELDLRYLPAGVHLLAHFRPEEIGAHPEGEKIVAVLGAWGAGLLANFQRWYPGSWQEVPSVMLSVSSGVHGKLHYSMRIQLATAWTGRMLQERIEQHENGLCESRKHQQHKYVVAAGISYWLPVDAAGKTLLVCLQEDMPSLIDNSQEPLGLPRDVQRLVASTDQQRMFTALSLVKFLQGAGKKLITENTVSAYQMPSALAWLWGEDATSVAISMHWDQDFFMEYLAVATLDVRPHHYQRQLGKRIEELPSWCQRYLHSHVIEPYGHQVLTRLPGMLEKLLVYTRSGTEQGHVVLRSYLPLQAGHNLLLAGSLCLTAISSEDQHETDTLAASENSVAAIGDKLASITSLVLPKETLEQSLRILAEDIGVEIELLGQDLQLAGITKNQSFGINLRNRPASEILLEILCRANPVQNTTGPADRKQMLVYSIKREEEGAWRILVTTRAAATGRGDSLPDVFRPRAE